MGISKFFMRAQRYNRCADSGKVLTFHSKHGIMSEFRPVDWICSSNIYEVNLRQYTIEGSFTAFIREMPRLKDMGIEVLWFMPITPISAEKRLGSLGSYYACSDYTSINPEYGNLEDFTVLVKEAHALG